MRYKKNLRYKNVKESNLYTTTGDGNVCAGHKTYLKS